MPLRTRCRLEVVHPLDMKPYRRKPCSLTQWQLWRCNMQLTSIDPANVKVWQVYTASHTQQL